MDGPEAEAIRSFLRGAQVAVIGTAAGEDIRLRMMHVGFEDDFTLYVASMRGDPKVMQLLHNPSVAILVHRLPEDVREAEEVEYTGRAVLLRDGAERERCLQATARTSPIVRALREQGNTGVLDCIRIVPQVIKYRRFRDIVQGVPPTVLEFPQHREAVSDWWRIGTRLRAWWVALRPNSLAAAIVPVVLGTAVAFGHYGLWHPLRLAAVLLGALLLQAGTNLINDYHDHRTGNDAANRAFVRPFGGGSRVIQSGLLAPADVLFGGVVLGAAALAVGLGLAMAGRPWVIPMALLGAAIGLLYNRPGWSLVHLGLGEAAVALCFGPLITVGADYVQSGHAVDPLAVLASLPVGLLIAAVLLINEFQDEAADRATGKRTAVVRWGRQTASGLLAALLLGAFALLALLPALGLMPWASWGAAITLPLAWRAAAVARRHADQSVELAPANGYTALIHLGFGLLLALGYCTAAPWAVVLALATLFVGFSVAMYRYTEQLRQAAAASRQAVA